MANEEALIELVNVIGEANDKGLWDQAHWAAQTECGTVCCAAGWKALIDGKEIAFDTANIGEYTYFTADGDDIEEYAAVALDLTEREAWHLFHGTYDNNYGEFVARVKEVINGEIV